VPEGVEVRLSAETIRPIALNKRITDIELGSSSRYASQFPEESVEFINDIHRDSYQVSNIKTKGKFMYWIFTNPNKKEWYLLNTFGMSGHWGFQTSKHLCLKICLGLETSLYFSDPRHFGTIKFTHQESQLLDKLNQLGWDPLQNTWANYKSFVLGQLKVSNKYIGEVLMNQSIFAGVGNYIRAEALYQARLSPWRQASMLTENDIETLAHSIIKVMQESYAHQGATILTYKDAYGAEGKYSSCFQVYGKKTDPLGHPIKKENTPDGRAIHWCPTIQV
jgi:formamidopyrimidine-DNA glycosylase